MEKMDLALAKIFLEMCNTGGVKYRFCHFCHYMMAATACFIRSMMQIDNQVRQKNPGCRWCKKCGC
jgi:hypothetical protein